MDIFNKEKVARLEVVIAMLKQDIELYKSRCTQLEGEVKNTKDLELKVKCLQMWCDDDEAIDELMAAVKEKDKRKPEPKPEGYDALFSDRCRQQQPPQQASQLGQAQMGQLGMGALGGLFGRGY